jgi:hypothetical protein
MELMVPVSVVFPVSLFHSGLDPKSKTPVHSLLAVPDTETISWVPAFAGMTASYGGRECMSVGYSDCKPFPSRIGISYKFIVHPFYITTI